MPYYCFKLTFFFILVFLFVSSEYSPPFIKSSEYSLPFFKSSEYSPIIFNSRFPSPTTYELSRSLSNSLYSSQDLVKSSLYVKILILVAGVVAVSYCFLLQMSYQVLYIQFDFNLSMYKRKSTQKRLFSTLPLLYFLISIILLSNSEMDQILSFFAILSPDICLTCSLNKKRLNSYHSFFMGVCVCIFLAYLSHQLLVS